MRSALLLFLLLISTQAYSEEATCVGVEIQGSPEVRRFAQTLRLHSMIGKQLTDALVLDGVEKLKQIGRAAAVKVDFYESNPDKVWIVYRVRENPIIKSIKFRGNTEISEEELLAELKIKPGVVLDWDILYREVNRIPDIYLSKKGILYAGTLSPQQVTEKDGVVTIELQEYKLKRVIVSGISGPLKEMVMASLELRRGSVLKRSDLLGSLCNVYQLPQIEDIDYQPKFDREKGEFTLVLDITKQK